MIYYGYNGESTNVKTGLQYLRARYYDAENGTFTTEDDNLGTTEKPLTRNRYDYTTNNPVNYSDPTGHSLWKRIKRTAKKVVSSTAVSNEKIKQGLDGNDPEVFTAVLTESVHKSLEKNNYGKTVTVKVSVEKDNSGKYSLSDTEMNKLESAMFPTD